jgi:hypothetical protein
MKKQKEIKETVNGVARFWNYTSERFALEARIKLITPSKPTRFPRPPWYSSCYQTPIPRSKLTH